MSFGHKDGGWWVQAPRRPSVLDFGFHVDGARPSWQNPADAAPIPIGWGFGRHRTRLVIAPNQDAMAGCKQAFGRVSSVGEDKDAEDSESPSALKLVANLPVLGLRIREQIKLDFRDDQ